MIRIAFDVDGTLITLRGDTPKYEVINALRKMNCMFKGQVELYVWSNCGNDHAQQWVDKLGLSELVTVIEKGGRDDIDICYDDQEVTLAKVNLKVL